MPLFEPEETVGRYWHRLVGLSSSYRQHPEAAVSLDAVRHRLAVMFRALGGSGAVRLVSSAPLESGHRLNLRQRVGLGREKLDRAVFDGGTLRLPAVLDVFPAGKDNEALYEWLAAWFAHAGAPPDLPDDPLQADLVRLRAVAATTRATLAAWPGLRALCDRLSAALLSGRPQRRLPPQEAAVEAALRALLGDLDAGAGRDILAAVTDATIGLDDFRAARGYRTFLPVPLWGEVTPAVGTETHGERDEPGGGSGSEDARRRRAKRRSNDQSRRGDPLVLHRFETILGLSEMVNVNRPVEDDDEEGARQAADDLSELSVGAHDKTASTRLKLDLDLAPAEAEGEAIAAEITYPEWDWRRRAYRRDYCRVVVGPASLEGEDWTPDPATRRRIRQVRRQFEALRPKRQTFYGQPDGDDLDLTALVRDMADRRAGGTPSERVFVQHRTAARELSLAVLMDVSLSTDSYVQDRRVLEVEKGALLALTGGLTACGDEHAIFTFTSRRRSWISVATVKDFDEELSPRVLRRIQALKPGHYTRIGAAVRHMIKALEARPHRHRLILILTDGKPNDVDHYEGRYGIEDTRMAIREARQAGIRVFGVTVDEQARDYFPFIFGRGAYAIFPDIARLPIALPAIYRQITA